MAAFLALLLSLVACADAPSIVERRGWIDSFGFYKPLVVQGNFISKEQAAHLKPGMSKTMVKDVLGTPLVNSLFHKDRWDYVFVYRREGVQSVARRLTVFFKADLLERIESDDLPSETEFVAQFDSSRRFDRAPALQATPAQLEKFANQNQKTPSAILTDELPARLPLTGYPPLE